MRYLTRRTVIGVCLALLLSSSGCDRKRETDTRLASGIEPSSGELHVVFTSPKQQTRSPHESESVLVVFDSPMTSLQALPDSPSPEIIEFEPHVSGNFSWLNPKTLQFRPKNRFPLATTIKARIPAGLRSRDGHELSEGFSWEFQTPRPRLLRHFPKNKQRWLDLDTEILLIFNSPVRAGDSREFISLVEIDPASETGSSREFSLRHPEASRLKDNRISDPPENVLTMSPRRPLTSGRRYVVELRPGMPGREGDLGMEETVLFEFSPFTPFEFIAIESERPHDPRQSVRFVFSNPVPYQELIRNLHIDPELKIPEYYRDWDQSNDRLWLTLPFQPETEYEITIEKGLLDRFGTPLGREIRKKILTAPYESSIDMTTGHGILESRGDMRYPIYAVNTPDVRVQAGRVSIEDALSLLSREEHLWGRKTYEKTGIFTVDRSMRLNRSRNRREIFPIEIGELCPDRTGLVLLQLVTDSPNEWNRFPKAFIQVTNLGITGKYSPDNSVLWITTLDEGLPVEDAQVEIRTENGKIIWRGRSGPDGRCQAPGWKELGLRPRDQWSRPRQWVTVHLGKDVALTSSDWETGVYPYRFGISYDWNPEPDPFRGQIFSERGIYRAGETVHLKGIVRSLTGGGWVSSKGSKISCEIRDPFDKPLLSRELTLDEFGSWNLDFDSRDDAALGRYRVISTLDPKGRRGSPENISGSFRLEAFRPAEFELHLRSERESYVFGEKYQAEIKASYLFGGAMASQDLTWHLRLNPANYSPPGYDGYSFGRYSDPWEDRPTSNSRLISSGNVKLDSNGRFLIESDLVPENEEGAVTAALEATVSGPSRRTISSRIGTLIHRGSFYIGLQTDNRFLHAGEDLTCRTLTVSPDGAPDPGRRIELRLIRREWRSVRKSEMGGRFRWISERNDIEVEKRGLRTKKDAVETRFRIEKSGSYVVIAESRDEKGNPVTSSTMFYATGSDYIPWERRDDDSLELVPDRTRYRPGDTARILIKSPYERAQALITLEREFILESRVVEVEGSSYPLDIPIRSDFIPNVFVSVLLVQGRTSSEAADQEQDMGKPSFKLGYAELSIDPEEKRLHVEILGGKEAYRPGETVSLRFRVSDFQENPVRSCLSVAVVDVGVLNLIGYTTPDPFSLFYRPKSLSVQTSEIRHKVVGQRTFGEKGDEVGGGSGEALRAAARPLSEVELRGDFRFTAFWEPALVTDDSGGGEVRFKLPDNLSTFRVMVVAQTEESLFGRGNSSFRITKPLLLQSACPRFARMGDEFSAGVVIHNQSGRDGHIQLNGEADGLAFIGKDQKRRFELKDGESREILYRFQAREPGRAVLRFQASMGAEKDGLETDFPVILPRPKETVALFGQSRESVTERVTIPESPHPSSGRLKVQTSATALSGLEASLSHLREYPYLCLEQRVSSILPYLVASDIIQEFRLTTQSKDEIRAHLTATLKEITAYQRESGGFGLWPDSRRDSPFNTCYAGYALIKARELGFPIERSVMDKLADYLRSLVRGRRESTAYPYSKKSWQTTRAYALYVLTLLGQPDSSSMESLFQSRNELSPFGRVMLLKALFLSRGARSSRSTLLSELENRLKVSPTLAHFEDDPEGSGRWIYASSLRNTACLLQALLEVDVDNPLIPSIARWLVRRRDAGGWISTQDHSFAFHALNDYFTRFESREPDFDLNVTFGSRTLLEAHIASADKDIRTAETSLSEWKAGREIDLKFDKQGPGQFYYQTRMTYAPSRTSGASDRGFTIYKNFSTPDGRPITEPRAGQLVVVTLQIITPQERLFVVVDDPLPAGLEALHPDFRTTSREDLKQLENRNRDTDRPDWIGFNHIEIHDDRVLLFADSLPPGIHVHRYLARALSFGDFTAPGPCVKEMYSPEVFGRGPEDRIRIDKK